MTESELREYSKSRQREAYVKEEPRSVSEILKQSYPQYLNDTPPRMSYQEQLKHAKWRKRSNEICERDHWRCRDCSAESNLTVHHCVYLRGKLLWEYPDSLLMTICWKCHQFRQEREEAVHVAIARHLALMRPHEIEERAWELFEIIYKAA